MKPQHVTKTAERRYIPCSKRVRVYNVYPEDIIYSPCDDFPELFDRSVHEGKKPEADKLSLALHALGPNPKRELAQPIVEKLVAMCDKRHEEMTTRERWDETALEMPQDIGGPNRRKFIDIITKKSRGNVLETMAGFNTYIEDTQDISKVTALDYSEQMLMRYPQPERTRILFDLNEISKTGIGLDFFKKGEFQTIACCYGVNYLKDPTPVFQEFNRILSPGGKFLVLGNTGAGYKDLEENWFKPEPTKRDMVAAGFTTSYESFPELKTEMEIGDYYLLTGIKN